MMKKIIAIIAALHIVVPIDAVLTKQSADEIIKLFDTFVSEVLQNTAQQESENPSTSSITTYDMTNNQPGTLEITQDHTTCEGANDHGLLYQTKERNLLSQSIPTQSNAKNQVRPSFSKNDSTTPLLEGPSSNHSHIQQKVSALSKHTAAQPNQSQTTH